MTLDRLLRRARLSERQAAYLLVEVIRDLIYRQDEGWPHEEIGPATVRVGVVSGQVRLVASGPEPATAPESPYRLAVTSAPARHRRDLIAAAAMVVELTAAAAVPAARQDRLGPELQSALADLTAALEYAAGSTDRIAAGGPDPVLDRVAAVSGILGPNGLMRARTEVARLAGAIQRVPSASPPVAAPLVPRQRRTSRQAPAVTVAPQARHALGHVSVQTTLTRLAWWLVALAALAGIAGLQVAFLGEKLTANLSLLTGAPGPAGGAGPAPIDPAPPLPVIGPPAAGPITQVALRAVGPCAPGSTCLVRVLVGAEERPAARPVPWRVVLVDRCGGALRTAGGGTMTIPPQEPQGSALLQLRLPVTATALIAQTTSPAEVASVALPVPAEGITC